MSLELTPAMERLGFNTNPREKPSTDRQIASMEANISYVAVSTSGAALGDVKPTPVSSRPFQPKFPSSSSWKFSISKP